MSAQSLVDDVDFRLLILAMVVAFKLTNMGTERQLALIRKAICDDHGVFAERMLSSGFVAQVLSEHVRLGRTNPRAVTRAQLLEAGVPLRAAAGVKGVASSAGGVFPYWMRRKEHERKTSGISFNRDQYTRWQQARAAEWMDLPDEDKAVFAAQMNSEFEKRAWTKSRTQCYGTVVY